MSCHKHVRFEFFPGWSTEARVNFGDRTVPIRIDRPVFTPQNISQPPIYSAWNWTWMDGQRYQLRCPIIGLATSPLFREELLVNDHKVADGALRGPRFAFSMRQWLWKMGPTAIETRFRLGCHPRSSLCDVDRRCLAAWIPRKSRICGVIRGDLDQPLTPLLWGMVLSTLVKPGATYWNPNPFKR